MKDTTRRLFVLQVAAGGALIANASAIAQTTTKTDPKVVPPAADMVDPKSPTAQGLNYIEDTTKVDKVKFPKHEAAQACANCQLYAGKSQDVAGPCPIFANKKVAAKGWCSAYVKKA